MCRSTFGFSASGRCVCSLPRSFTQGPRRLKTANIWTRSKMVFSEGGLKFPRILRYRTSSGKLGA